MMAGLVDPFRRDVYCGATIVSKRHVLTAAHCLTDKDTNNVGVLVGDHDLNTGKNACLIIEERLGDLLIEYTYFIQFFKISINIIFNLREFY